MDKKWIAIIIAIALFFYWQKNKKSSTLILNPPGDSAMRVN